MKILIATEKPFAPVAVKGIREIVENSGHELMLLEKYTEKQQLIESVKQANAVIVRSDIIDKEVIEAAAPNLKVVVRAGAGYDNVDIVAATANNVCVMNTPGQNSNAVAELVFGLLIYLQRAGFCGVAGSELKGKKLGLHAFGNIGKITARIAQGFGMEVFAFSPSLARDPQKAEKYNVTPVTKPEELYDKCDIVSLHMPANDQTRESINYDLLSRMQQNGTLINTARKEVINEADLMRIMEERPKFKYGTDIKLANHEEAVSKFGVRYLASDKKCGAQTSEANVNAGLAAARQIVNYFKDGNEEFRVNPK